MLYDVKCNHCGTMNVDIDLEETKGCFECENCGEKGFVSQFFPPNYIPVVEMDHLIEFLEKQKSKVSAVTQNE